MPVSKLFLITQPILAERIIRKDNAVQHLQLTEEDETHWQSCHILKHFHDISQHHFQGRQLCFFFVFGTVTVVA